MIKKYLTLIFIIIFFNTAVYAAENVSSSNSAYKSGNDDKTYMIGKNSNYKRGLDALKQAKKYDKKGKSGKAKKRFNDAIKFLTIANKEFPNEPDILNYLGYSFKKVGDFAMAEIYYEQGLAINPEHVETNEYLGELYVETNRINKAKERLAVLKNCNCEEYAELKGIIEGTK